MAVQAGMGLGRVIILIGAGLSMPIVLRNGRLSDILNDLQDTLRSSENAGDDSELTKTLSDQVRRLTEEVRRYGSSRPITVLNGNSGPGGSLTALLVPAATLGALGYGYMWWKGISFSDLMYVTKRNMANAVSSMTKHLEQVSATLAATKRHLTQRIENLDGKLDEQKEISGEIKKEVTEACGKLDSIGFELESLQALVGSLDGKMAAIEDKQNFACAGVLYLCQFVDGKAGKLTDYLPNGPKTTGKRNFIDGAGLKSLKDLQHIAESDNFDKKLIETILPKENNSVNLKGLSRVATFKC